MLATAYLTYALTSTIGPFGSFDDLRDRFDKRSVLGMLHCPWCAAIWCAMAVDMLDLSIDLEQSLSNAFVAGLLCWSIDFVRDFAIEYLRTPRLPHE